MKVVMQGTIRFMGVPANMKSPVKINRAIYSLHILIRYCISSRLAMVAYGSMVRLRHRGSHILTNENFRSKPKTVGQATCTALKLAFDVAK